MLRITIPTSELWDEANQEFVTTKEQTLQLEHSLVSLSKWESKWHKAFLDEKNQKDRTHEETLDYVRCMTITQNIDPKVYGYLTNENIKQINDYIGDPMTATNVPEKPGRPPVRETPTSELIYYWMIALNIPFECQKWHLNRLLTLIKVCNFKNTPPKKMSRRDVMSRNAALNAARRKQMNSRG